MKMIHQSNLSSLMKASNFSVMQIESFSAMLLSSVIGLVFALSVSAQELGQWSVVGKCVFIQRSPDVDVSF